MKFISDAVYDFKNNKVLLIMLFPAILYFLVFSYIPMFGIVLAFKRLDYSLGIFNSPNVGFDNFKFFFISGSAFRVTMNTVLYNIAFLAAGIVLPTSLAIFLSEMKNKYFKKTVQSMMLLPYFISWVIVGAFVYNIFNYEFGSLNTVMKSVGLEPVDVYGNVGAWKYILVFFQSWKYAGYGTVIYLAAITSIDIEVYEAAVIDGVGIFQKILYIILPHLKPTIIILSLISIGNVFRGDFNMFYQIIGNNGMLYETTDVIDTFVFRSLMFTQEYGMAAASGLYQSVLCFVLIVITNKAIKLIDKDYSLF